MSVWMSSKTSEVLLASNLLFLVCFPLIQLIHMLKSVKSKGSRISSDTSLSILYLEIWPNLLCHNAATFSLVNFLFTPHVLNCMDSLNEAIVSCIKYIKIIIVWQRTRTNQFWIMKQTKFFIPKWIRKTKFVQSRNRNQIMSKRWNNKCFIKIQIKSSL